MTFTAEFSGIVKSYGSTRVLDDVTISCAGGRIHALVGENGAGKSTLLKILLGEVAADSGSLILGNDPVDLEHLNPLGATHLGIAMVHQEFALIPHMTITENIFLGRELGRWGNIDRKAMRRRAQELLDQVGSPLSPDSRVEFLSVADSQLVEIAKALSTDARVLALDEPSAVLSGHELETLLTVVADLKRQGVAIIYVSHRMDELFSMCDDFSVLKDGKVAGQGLIAETTRDQIVRMMVGRDVSQVFPAPSKTAGELRLECHGLAIEGLPRPINLSIRRGEIVGVAGLGGSGRTRLAKGIFGAIPAHGKISIDSISREAFQNPSDAIAAGVAYLPEDRKHDGLALSKSVASNSTLLTMKSITRRGLLSQRAEKMLASIQIGRFGIRSDEFGSDSAGSLSGGNQQKVVFAKWLEAQPKVVILDEPTRGIDVGSKEAIYTIIRNLADEGVSFLVISSELIEVLGLSDRVLVMADGRIIGQLDRGATEEDVMSLITSSSDDRAGSDDES